MSDPTGPGDAIDWAIRDQPLTTRPVPVTEPTSGYLAPIVPPTPPAPQKRTGLVVGLVVAAVVVLALAGGAGIWLLNRGGGVPVIAPKVATFTTTGTLTISGGCYGLGYSDIHSGVQVTVTGEDGKLLGVGQLANLTGCSWAFTIPDLPAGHQWYGVTISRRGTVQFTEAEMRAGPKLTLG